MQHHSILSPRKRSPTTIKVSSNMLNRNVKAGNNNFQNQKREHELLVTDSESYTAKRSNSPFHIAQPKYNRGQYQQELPQPRETVVNLRGDRRQIGSKLQSRNVYQQPKPESVEQQIQTSFSVIEQNCPVVVDNCPAQTLRVVDPKVMNAKDVELFKSQIDHLQDQDENLKEMIEKVQIQTADLNSKLNPIDHTVVELSCEQQQINDKLDELNEKLYMKIDEIKDQVDDKLQEMTEQLNDRMEELNKQVQGMHENKKSNALTHQLDFHEISQIQAAPVTNGCTHDEVEAIAAKIISEKMAEFQDILKPNPKQEINNDEKFDKTFDQEGIHSIVNKQVSVKLEQFDKMYEKTFHDQVNELIEFRHDEMEIGYKQKLDQAVEVLQQKQQGYIDQIRKITTQSQFQQQNGQPQISQAVSPPITVQKQIETLQVKLSTFEDRSKDYVKNNIINQMKALEDRLTPIVQQQVSHERAQIFDSTQRALELKLQSKIEKVQATAKEQQMQFQFKIDQSFKAVTKKTQEAIEIIENMTNQNQEPLQDLERKLIEGDEDLQNQINQLMKQIENVHIENKKRNLQPELEPIEELNDEAKIEEATDVAKPTTKPKPRQSMLLPKDPNKLRFNLSPKINSLAKPVPIELFPETKSGPSSARERVEPSGHSCKRSKSALSSSNEHSVKKPFRSSFSPKKEAHPPVGNRTVDVVPEESSDSQANDATAGGSINIAPSIMFQSTPAKQNWSVKQDPPKKKKTTKKI